MSTKKDFVKEGDLEFTEQLIGYHENIGTYAALFGITPAELTSIEDDREYMQFAVLGVSGGKAYSEAWTKLKNEARKGGGGAVLPPFPLGVDLTNAPTVVAPDIEGRFRNRAKLHKLHPAYTPAIGEILKIVAVETDEPDLSTARPVLKPKLAGDHVDVGWGKQTLPVDALEIHVKRGAAVYVYLATDTTTPKYVDTYPFPATAEEWTYKGIYIVDGIRVGLWSEEVSITVKAG